LKGVLLAAGYGCLRGVCSAGCGGSFLLWLCYDTKCRAARMGFQVIPLGRQSVVMRTSAFCFSGFNMHVDIRHSSSNPWLLTQKHQAPNWNSISIFSGSSTPGFGRLCLGVTLRGDVGNQPEVLSPREPNRMRGGFDHNQHQYRHPSSGIVPQRLCGRNTEKINPPIRGVWLVL